MGFGVDKPARARDRRMIRPASGTQSRNSRQCIPPAQGNRALPIQTCLSRTFATLFPYPRAGALGAAHVATDSQSTSAQGFNSLPAPVARSAVTS